MRRRLFAILSVLSLSLCAATAVLWIRSHHVYDDFGGAQRSIYCEVLSAAGVLHLEVAIHVPISIRFSHHSDGFLDDEFRPIYSELHPIGTGLGNDSGEGHFGFGYNRGIYDFLQSGETPSDSQSPMFGVHGPHWAMTCLFGILPGRWLLSYCRYRRRCKFGLCQQCGYDLRVTSGRCPECGRKSTIRGVSDG